MKKFAVAVITFGMLLSGAAVANALTIGGDGVAGYYDDYGPEATAWNTALSLNQFDSSLGTLTKIELFLSGSETSAATVTASSTQNASWLSVSVQTYIRLFDPSNIATTLMLVTPAVSDSGGSLAAGGTYNLVGSGTDSDNTALTSSSAAFNLFIGSSTISLSTSAMSFGSTTALSNGTFTPAGTASEHLYVVYTYDASSPVPEPATMLLFGTGLAGIAAISRRKKA